MYVLYNTIYDHTSIVKGRVVALRYDLLRFSLCSKICPAFALFRHFSWINFKFNRALNRETFIFFAIMFQPTFNYVFFFNHYVLSLITGGVGGAVSTRPLDANPLNFGTYGNGHPQMGVVTGNLGGSLGLGGIGGIDGGNALTVNHSVAIKKSELVCRGHPLKCVWSPRSDKKRSSVTPHEKHHRNLVLNPYNPYDRRYVRERSSIGTLVVNPYHYRHIAEERSSVASNRNVGIHNRNLVINPYYHYIAEERSSIPIKRYYGTRHDINLVINPDYRHYNRERPLIASKRNVGMHHRNLVLNPHNQHAIGERSSLPANGNQHRNHVVNHFNHHLHRKQLPNNHPSHRENKGIQSGKKVRRSLPDDNVIFHEGLTRSVYPSPKITTKPEAPKQESASAKNYVIRPVHRKPLSETQMTPLPGETSSPSDPLKSTLPSMPSLMSAAAASSDDITKTATSATASPTSNDPASSRSIFNVNPKPYAGANMVSAIDNLLTQRLSNAQKFGPAVIGKVSTYIKILLTRITLRIVPWYSF